MAVPSATSLTMMSMARPEACSPWLLHPPYDVICGKAWHTERKTRTAAEVSPLSPE